MFWHCCRFFNLYHDDRFFWRFIFSLTSRQFLFRCQALLRLLLSSSGRVLMDVSSRLTSKCSLWDKSYKSLSFWSSDLSFVSLSISWLLRLLRPHHQTLATPSSDTSKALIGMLLSMSSLALCVCPQLLWHSHVGYSLFHWSSPVSVTTLWTLK